MRNAHLGDDTVEHGALEVQVLAAGALALLASAQRAEVLNGLRHGLAEEADYNAPCTPNVALSDLLVGGVALHSTPQRPLKLTCRLAINLNIEVDLQADQRASC